MSEKAYSIGETICLCCIAVLVCIVTAIISAEISRSSGLREGVELVQQQAVLKGHGQWVPDEHGKPQFKWNGDEEE